MPTETLEDDKPLHESPHQEQEKQEAAAESKEQEEKAIPHEVASVEVDNSESEPKIVDENARESDQVEEKKEEDSEHEDDEEEEDEEGSAKLEEDSESKKSKKEKEATTPASASERPIRERKSVERYTVSSPSKFPRSSSTKTLSIEKGHGTQLKDIPNGTFIRIFTLSFFTCYCSIGLCVYGVYTIRNREVVLIHYTFYGYTFLAIALASLTYRWSDREYYLR